jgi:hypothetical protein
MKTHIVTGVLFFALLLSSGGVIYYRQRAVEYRNRLAEASTQPPLKNEPSNPVETTRSFHLSATNSTDEIMQEFDALLLELEQKDRELAELQSVTNRTRSARNRLSGSDRQARMEELKQTDPEAYAEMMARREERLNRVQTAFAERAVTLLDRTPSNLSEEDFEQREKMLQMLDETWQLTEQMNSPDTPREARREIRDELTEKSKELRPLLAEERDRQLYELGVSSGYSESEAESFVDYIHETIKATSLPNPGDRRRR